MATEQSVSAVIRASRPSFRNPYDKMAFAVHASFLAAGYVLHATGPPAFSENALSSTTTDEVGIDQWNEFEDEYAFLYSHPGKGPEKVLLKCLAMNGKLLVDSVRDGGSNPAHLEISVGDYDKENSGTNYGSMYKDLDKLVKAVDAEILSKLHDSPKQSSKDQPSSSDQQSPSSRTRDDVVTEPQSDPYYPGLRFPNVGDNDLFPGPGAGMYPTRDDFGGGGGGGGMFVGPDHPMFGGLGRGRVGPGFPGGLPGVLPGARFDPFGPPGVPGFEPNRFVRDPRRPGGRGTHPDLEHFPDGNDFI